MPRIKHLRLPQPVTLASLRREREQRMRREHWRRARNARLRYARWAVYVVLEDG